MFKKLVEKIPMKVFLPILVILALIATYQRGLWSFDSFNFQNKEKEKVEITNPNNEFENEDIQQETEQQSVEELSKANRIACKKIDQIQKNNMYLQVGDKFTNAKSDEKVWLATELVKKKVGGIVFAKENGEWLFLVGKYSKKGFAENAREKLKQDIFEVYNKNQHYMHYPDNLPKIEILQF